MGQRLLVRSKRRAGPKGDIRGAAQPAVLSVFDTELGWFGLVGRDDTVIRLFIGHDSAEQVRKAAANTTIEPHSSAPLGEGDWNPKLRRALQNFARGVPTDFADVKIDVEPATPFRKRVLGVVRRLGYGRTATYGELAARAGKRGAGRAVGAVMRSNPIPIIIPCHRVVASGGGLGGFSAPRGIVLKQRMLEIEAVAR